MAGRLDIWDLQFLEFPRKDAKVSAKTQIGTRCVKCHPFGERGGVRKRIGN